MAFYSIDKGGFSEVLSRYVETGCSTYLPRLTGDRWSWRKAEGKVAAEDLSLGPARADGPIKSLFFPPRGKVASFFDDDPAVEVTKRIVVGARQCDVSALAVLDYIFLEAPFKDPFYAARRENTVIISADCTEPHDVCFCALVGGGPSAMEGFDLNLTPGGNGFLVEVGSEKGAAFIEKDPAAFREASEAEVAERGKSRVEVADGLVTRLKDQNLDFADKVRHVTRGKEEDEVWSRRSDDCVECGGCCFVCPTCHCFSLLDVTNNGGVSRSANWDSCLYPRFAQVAGGGDPRARRAQRLLNRFEKKFSFFCDTIDEVGCTGCGRCIESCAGKVDVREVLKELTK